MFFAEPMTTTTANPLRSMREASSVPTKPSAVASSKAFLRMSYRNPCGVCAKTTPARGIVVLMIAPSEVRSTCLTVSTAGKPAMAA